MIDNFNQIRYLLSFDNDDEFYFCQILKRKKENRDLGSNSHLIKAYYIRSFEGFDLDKGEMVCLAKYHNARVYINLNKRSFEHICYHNLKSITDHIMNKDFRGVMKSYNSCCGSFSTDYEKKWIIDIDEIGDIENDILSFINTIRPEGDKLIATLNTKNGIHLITKPFDIQAFKDKFPNIDVHKNNPTILYTP